MRKTRRITPLAAVVILASSLSCREAPTEPKASSPPPPPNSSPASVEGFWSGTISFGTDYRKACTGSQNIGVQITQRDRAVEAEFRTDCEGMLTLRGSLSSNYLAADFVRGDGTSIGKLTGSASSTLIQLENRDGDPWGYGDPTIGLQLKR